MSKVYRSREGTISAVDTKTQLTTLGSESAPGPLLVPANAKSIKALITAFTPDFGNATGGTIFIRLEGPGLPEGPETLAIGGAGARIACGVIPAGVARIAKRFWRVVEPAKSTTSPSTSSLPAKSGVMIIRISSTASRA